MPKIRELVRGRPGRVSIDALAGLNLGSVRWSLLALVLGLVAGGIQLASRRRPAAAEGMREFAKDAETLSTGTQ